MQERHHNKTIPKWLRDIEENSWNVELLISGGAIVSLLQFPDFLIDLKFTLSITNQLPGTNLFIIFGMFSIKLLTLGFILHLMMRAYWLGLLCINYVYRSGIQKEKIQWKKPYQYSVEQGDNLYDSIIRVDRWCGVIMYLSIISTVIVIGLIAAIFILLTVPSTLIGNDSLIQPLFKLVMVCVSIYLVDLLTFSFLRKVPVLSYLLYPLFRLLDIVTLRFLYQKSLWLFNTNISKTSFAIGFGAVLLLAWFFTYISIYRVMLWPNLVDARDYRFQMAPEQNWWNYATYRDENEKEGGKLTAPSIQSDIINENYLKVHLPYYIDADKYIKLGKLNTLSELAEVQIDDSLYTQVEWYNAWARNIDQLGIRANIPIHHLQPGKHMLIIRNRFEHDMIQHIPFWKE